MILTLFKKGIYIVSQTISNNNNKIIKVFNIDKAVYVLVMC